MTSYMPAHVLRPWLPAERKVRAKDGCGACHQHGHNPRVEDGKCVVCERTLEQIEISHGFVYLEEC